MRRHSEARCAPRNLSFVWHRTKRDSSLRSERQTLFDLLLQSVYVFWQGKFRSIRAQAVFPLDAQLFHDALDQLLGFAQFVGDDLDVHGGL